MNTFEVESSHGLITANAETGEIINIEPYGADGELKYLQNIQKFNIDEWEQRRKEAVRDNGIDILDIGYWLKDGSYQNPEPQG